MYRMPFSGVGNNSVSVNYGGSGGRAVTIDSQVVQDDVITGHLKVYYTEIGILSCTALAEFRSALL